MELEDGTERVFENATSIDYSISNGDVAVHVFDPETTYGHVEYLPLSDVAAWTEERAWTPTQTT